MVLRYVAENKIRRQATPAELDTYAIRASQFLAMADVLRTNVTMCLSDKQVRALALTWANECDQLAKRWAKEREGGL